MVAEAPKHFGAFVIQFNVIIYTYIHSHLLIQIINNKNERYVHKNNDPIGYIMYYIYIYIYIYQD
jgi:hypothetical protein